MSRYILIRRLRGPAFLLLVGVNALLAQAHILGWGHSWPFYLICWACCCWPSARRWPRKVFRFSRRAMAGCIAGNESGHRAGRGKPRRKRRHGDCARGSF